ncbi:ankyrin repeat domain-containing protein 37 isoform X2 [Acomys russatus]|uniref:ankyrin repeat domain-containing protein 37 isoform X2 n=1 Tax=Acomys russatus TaxID=60746 RepID=UPI0021E1CA65|nr:ankyrin repeat domain-containing protein 37 isoform X2 [Acomys russatus]
MLLLNCNLEEDGLKNLLETGASVNAPPDSREQSPVHLAAGGGLACFLLWQLQTGADLNQQDVLGETPLHKAAKAGSLECLSLLVASDVQIEKMSCWTRGGLQKASLQTDLQAMALAYYMAKLLRRKTFF